MSRTMTLPKIGVNMTEAVVHEWYVKQGDKIKEGDPILMAETDKVTQDIYATDSGIVGKLLVKPGTKVLTQEPIMILLNEGETLPEEEVSIKKNNTKIPQQKVSEQKAMKKIDFNKEQTIEKRIKISPLAKKLAKEMGLNIQELKPQREGERIVKKDVLAFAKKEGQNKPVVHSMPTTLEHNNILQVIPMSTTRKVIAKRMTESNVEKPCAALTLTACANEIIKLREKYKKRNIKISYNDILVKIASQALNEHRNINSVLKGEEIIILEKINIGVAVDSERGLMVPVIKEADKKNIQQIAKDFSEKVSSIRENKINTEDLTGGTFTITNLGMFEVEQFTPIINPPECCILAVGSIKQTFVPDDDSKPVLRSTIQLTLVFDHRIVDGAPAAKFLQSIKHYIECPELLI